MRSRRLCKTIGHVAVSVVLVLASANVLLPSRASQEANSKKDSEADAELHKAITSAGNDRAALVRNLKDYIQRFPASPRKANVYQALVEACQQLRDTGCALDYAEHLVAIEPDNSDMMLLAADLLQRLGDDASLTRAAGYVTRVIDRVEKVRPAEKPPQQSVTEWRDHQDQMRTGLYAVRGNVEKSQRNYDAALTDLRTSYSIYPNAVAAIMLAEIAEAKSDSATAIEQYSMAFMLPEDGPAGKVDHRDVRKKLGNVWRQVHGSDAGLGEEILSTYDRLASRPEAAKDNPAARNRGAKDAFDFVLRKVNGTPISLAPQRGKVLAISFWATWCSPCRTVEPLFDQVAKGYADNPKVEFLAVNTDEDESLVAPFLAHEKWTVPVSYADGLDVLLNVETLPTIIVLDRGGKTVYRTTGFTTRDFSAPLTKAIDSAVAQIR